MKQYILALAAAILPLASACAFADPAPSGSNQAITIYNENFAVVRETIPLNLTAGVNHVTYNNITYHVEPDSVILRDPTGARNLQVLEQNYRADPISQALLLSLYEGKTIDFTVHKQDHDETVQGTIIRSGYVPHNTYGQYGGTYYQQQQYYSSDSGGDQPIVEVNGQIHFGLPGEPVFPALTDDSILKPTLDWQVATDTAGPLNAELAYITDGMTWKADYNVISPPEGQGNDLSITAWVTIDNETGKTFDNAHIKLMAGNVNKVQPLQQQRFAMDTVVSGAASSYQNPVTEKTFDEYHLYTIDRPTTLRDRETKQVEFTRASAVHSSVLYVYDGARIDNDYGNNYNQILNDSGYGTDVNTKVWVMREIVNSKENHLGIPLPAGNVRFYRRDDDGQLEFVGENTIDHTPKDETLRIYTGNAFDLVGDRKQVSYKQDWNAKTADESFAITLNNHKDAAATVRVVEHLYRGANWTITDHSSAFLTKDAHTIEFDVDVPANGTQTVTYSAHYTW